MRKHSGLLTLCLLVLLAQACAGRHATASIGTSAHEPQSLVLISIDGFRWDYINRPGAVNLRALAAHGVRAERMVPSFPSLTFPNHYTIATGLYPDHHGIVSNAILDPSIGKFGIGDNPAVREPRWWGGEPIWVTAEHQHERAAPMSWPGAEAPIGGAYPSWWKKFDMNQPRSDKVHEVLALLALPRDSAPRLITEYFPDVDHEGHFFGPESAEVDAAIAHVDSAVGAIVDGISKLGLSSRVNIIVLADHGMTPLSASRTIYLDDYVSLDSMDVVEFGPTTSIAPMLGRERYVYDRLHGANPHMTVYHPSEIPARFHYGANPRIPAVVVLAEEGWTITTHPREQAATTPHLGNHGFDNQLLSMGALFIASGPAFKSGVVVPPFQNIHVYDLMAHVLALRPAPNDGSLDSTRAFLKIRGASSP
jgi:predicted AlkP superfamily pyrophosphatase or phosphodiesterase